MHKIILTEQEIEEILEPIKDHDHCWGMFAQSLIQAEIDRREREQNTKKLGPYGDWPVHGH